MSKEEFVEYIGELAYEGEFNKAIQKLKSNKKFEITSFDASELLNAIGSDIFFGYKFLLLLIEEYGGKVTRHNANILLMMMQYHKFNSILYSIASEQTNRIKFTLNDIKRERRPLIKEILKEFKSEFKTTSFIDLRYQLKYELLPEEASYIIQNLNNQELYSTFAIDLLLYSGALLSEEQIKSIPTSLFDNSPLLKTKTYNRVRNAILHNIN